MKRRTFLFSAILTLFSQNLFATVLTPKELNIYSDNSYLISEYITTVKGWKDLSINIPKNSLVFVEPLSCNLEYVEDKKLTSLKNYKELKEEIKTLEAQILALKSILKLSNNLNFEKNSKYINSIKALETFFEKKYLEYIELKERLDKKEKNLVYIEKTVQPVNISVFCQSIETVKIKTRSPINAKSEVFYYVLGNTKKNTVYLENRIKLKVDRDLKNIKVNIFQYKTRTPYLEYNSYPVRMMKIAGPKRRYNEATTRYFYTINNVSLKKNLNKNILISKTVLPTNFQIVINGRYGSVPNLIAYLKPKKMFPSAKAYFYIDGVFLKSDYMNTLQRGEKNKISFGEDKLVKVYKEKVKDITLKISKKRQRRYVKWRYTIKNKHDKKILVRLIDYIPVSSSYKIKIEPVSSLIWKEYDKVNGELIWEFSVPAGKEYILEFGYKETKPIENNNEK
ncbi:MAG: hypothetical protein DSY60_03640 [Persephonella sp.]|nr:MAG: hypothetical protein DSY60_03640 [Persephonella sp.]